VIKEIASEHISVVDLILNETTFNNAPKDISRYPSVKNLMKFQKKYEDIRIVIFFLIFSHLKKRLNKTSSISEAIESISDRSNDEQLLRNKGVSIPLSKNLEL
jgi:hypothetical protein